VAPSELLVVLLTVVVGLGILAQWLRIPYPILLVLGGLVLSCQSWAPRYELPPDIVFLAFLPPLLYAAAFNTEWPAFRRQLRAITLLAVGLVLFTTVVVAAVCHYGFGLSWPVGFLLGAIVSPPDAVAATAITQRIKVPRIVGTILEGESLVNDASALVAYKVALAACLSGVFVWWEAGYQFVLFGVGGVAVGLIGAWLVIRLHRWLDRHKLADAKLNIAITLLTPYFVYLPAEHLHVSGVLATVAAGLWVGWRCEEVFEVEFYDEAKAVWEMVEFLLNGLIFILIGFQLPLILDALEHDDGGWEKLVALAAAVVGTVILARMLWVFPGAYLPRWVDRKMLGKGDPYPAWQNVAVVGWTGMRGVVSLAAALAIPVTNADGQPFRERATVQFLTFAVILATLVGQGLTLPLLIRLLGVDRFAEAEKQAEEADLASC
jgi:CPA1 family monovalent cation:H+ antiporter